MADQNDKYIGWLKHEIDYYGRYHDHKETMAWVAIALYLAGIMYVAFQAREIAKTGGWLNPTLFSLFFAFSGYLVFCFVKWQFKKRWTAHEIVFGLHPYGWTDRVRRVWQGNMVCICISRASSNSFGGI